MAESSEILREALRLASRAFAQYALNTNDPPDSAVDDFVEGFIQDAKVRRVAASGRATDGDANVDNV